MTRTGRPPKLQPAQVLPLWKLSLPAQADLLGVSVATIKRQWKLLRDRGEVQLTDPRLPRRGSAGRNRALVPGTPDDNP